MQNGRVREVSQFAWRNEYYDSASRSEISPCVNMSNACGNKARSCDPQELSGIVFLGLRSEQRVNPRIPPADFCARNDRRFPPRYLRGYFRARRAGYAISRSSEKERLSAQLRKKKKKKKTVPTRGDRVPPSGVCVTLESSEDPTLLV